MKAGSAGVGHAQAPLARPSCGHLPLPFVPNAGQTDDRVRFLAQGHGYAVYCTRQGLVLKVVGQAGEHLSRGSEPAPAAGRPGMPAAVLQAGRVAVLALRFLDPDPALRVHGQEEGAGRVHFLRGNDPARWRVDLPTFAAVRYREVWPGIDCVVRGERGAIKLEWKVQPGACVERIRWTLQGADALALDANGNLTIETPLGTWTHERPVAYQIAGGRRVPRDCRFQVSPDAAGTPVIGLAVESGYDPELPLVVDPGLVVGYSTYLGGSGRDAAAAIAVDQAGNAYVAGSTVSPDFPTTPGAFQTGPQGGSDVFVAKLDPTGSTLLFSTYLGGSGTDTAHGVAVDGSGCVCVVGVTASSDFPLRNAVQPVFGGRADAFVSKLDPTGSSLVFSTYLGGASVDIGYGVAVDAAGAVYVAGSTDSSDFPVTPGAFQTTYRGFTDAFVAKLDPAGTTLAYSTFLGGTDGEEAIGIALDPAGDAYLTGYTFSGDFPVTPGAFQPVRHGLYDAFVARLAPDGSALVYSTYLGGTSVTYGAGIAVDAAGHAYVSGYTTSADFPTTPAAFQTLFGGISDAFVSKLGPGGDSLVYSTYLGGTGTDSGLAVAIDATGHACLTGETDSPNFPLRKAFQPTYGGGLRDAYVARLDPGGSSLDYSSYLGGSDYDYGTAVAVDAAGRTYLAGVTYSSDFPATPGAVQPVFGGATDAFVVEVLPAGTRATAEIRQVSCAEMGRTPLPDRPPGTFSVKLLVTVTLAYTLVGPTGVPFETFESSYTFVKTVQLRATEGTTIRCEALPSSAVVSVLLVDRQLYTAVSLCLSSEAVAAVRLLLPAPGACVAGECRCAPCPPTAGSGQTEGEDSGAGEVVCVATTLVVDACVQSELLEFAVTLP